MKSALCMALVVGACARHPRSAEDAYTRFSDAVRAGDGIRLYKSLDQKTRWAWMTVHRCHREAFDIVLSSYPEGPTRERELRRFEAGATSASAAELFGREVGTSSMAMLAVLVSDGARIELDGDRAAAALPSAGRVPFSRGEDGSWGFSGFGPDAKDRETRAIQDLELARASAADYERAAARAAR